MEQDNLPEGRKDWGVWGPDSVLRTNFRKINASRVLKKCLHVTNSRKIHLSRNHLS